MSFGASIFLMAVGAILAFAVKDSINEVDLTMIGYILIAAGAVGILLSFLFLRSSQSTSHTNVQERRTVENGEEVLHDRKVASDEQRPGSPPPGAPQA